MKVEVEMNVCTGCGVCAGECPAGAIVVGEFAVIDGGLCTGCGICVDACPVGALSLK